MANRQKLSGAPSQTTAQMLSSLLKSARDIMRKDKGLNGDLDRLPLLTWLMFLKFLDDLDLQREAEASLGRTKFRRAIDPPYRWRDWGARADGITGDELLSFVNAESCVRPDGTEGPGLFAYLRGLSSSDGDDRREVIATVFSGVDNRMKSGYLLRDVINKVHGIHFTSSEELHTLGALYESMLREMRDAAGDSGEFYTPRPVVRLMVDVIDPRLGETVLDPATGTGGFLVEAFAHMSNQVKTVADRKVLQTKSVFGVEPKPLPYLLAQMNLVLHGLDSPKLDAGNALRFKLTDIGDKDRVDVILTNPPFGGEEEKGIQGNFPEDKQTGETALLFLQLIMRRLRRTPTQAGRPARAGVVVPDGILAAGGVARRIKKALLEEFNLHTVVRLPGGVFSPYTGIPTNILFFDRSQQTKLIWFYEHTYPAGKKNYSKTSPLEYEEFAPLHAWWHSRSENNRAWRVTVDEAAAADYNLDVKNPSTVGEDFERPLPLKALAIRAQGETLASELVSTVKADIWQELETAAGGTWTDIVLGDVLEEVSQEERLDPEKQYRLLGVRLAAEGPYLRETKLGSEISATRLNRVSAGLFIYSRLFAWRGAFGIVPDAFDGCYVSNEFPTYRVRENKVLADFLRLYFMRPIVWRAVEKKCQGTTKASRNRFKEEFLLAMRVSIPPERIQLAAVEAEKRARGLRVESQTLTDSIAALPVAAMAALYRGRL